MRAEHEREFDDFVGHTIDRSYQLATAVLRDPAGSRAAVEEAYSGAYARWRQWRVRGDRDILLRRHLMGRILAQPTTPHAPVPREAAPDEQVVDCDTVWAALADLSPHQRAVLALRHHEGLSDAEIAASIGLPVDGVDSRVAEAMTALRQVLITPTRRQRV